VIRVWQNGPHDHIHQRDVAVARSVQWMQNISGLFYHHNPEGVKQMHIFKAALQIYFIMQKKKPKKHCTFPPPES